MSKEPGWLFTARWLDRLLRRRHADLFVAVSAAIAGCVAIANISQMASLGHLLASEASTLVTLSIVFASGGFLFVRVWRTLWRRGRDRWEILVYGHGVRGFGALMGLAICTMVVKGIGQYAFEGDFRGGYATLGFLAGVEMGGPIGLCGGYYWGMRMAAILGIERSQTDSDSNLPLVTD